jgi:penicillin-binding protein 1A
VLQPDVAMQLIDMLRAAVDRGTGRGIRDTHAIQADVAGKTGTTQNNTDGWFMLMRPNLVAGAWVGFNDPRVTLRSDHWGQGAHNALHVVGDFMRQALDEGAVDARAEFPSRPGATIQTALRRAGETLRNWLGFGAP